MDRVSINSARNYSRNANFSFFRSNRNRASNIPLDRKSFLQFFSRFQHFSNSISLSLSLYSSYPLRILFATVIYLRVSRSVRSASSDVRKIFYSIENGILIHAPTLLLRLFPSSRLEGGSFGVIFQRDVRPPRYSTLLGSFDVRKLDEETKRRAAAYGRIDGRTWMVLSVRKRVAGA